jgi:Fur family peroxide stress response transcriptional regulator
VKKRKQGVDKLFFFILIDNKYHLVFNTSMERKRFVSEKMVRLETLCREQGLPLTVQRRAILENLAARTDHPTADQVYDAVKGIVRGVSRTTVYRVLETLVGLGVVTRVSNPEARARFDADTARHHHLLCAGCGSVRDCHDERLNGIEVPAEVADGFEVKDFSLAITGLCGACRRQTAE